MMRFVLVRVTESGMQRIAFIGDDSPRFEALLARLRRTCERLKQAGMDVAVIPEVLLYSV